MKLTVRKRGVVKGHKVIVYRGNEHAFRNRWMCVCGILMPRVAFGSPLNMAFAEHLEEVERRKKEDNA